MKFKFKNILIFSLIISLIFSIVGCSLINKNNNNQDLNPYTLNVANINDYTNIDVDDIGVIVSSLVCEQQ